MARKVLIVEDERPILESVQYGLRKEGYEVFLAQDGETGLRSARSHRPDLIILDLMLPGMDGLEVCRALRRESQVPIIMLTAKSEEVDKVVGLEMGADDYVTKPFGMKELMARVKTVLRRAAWEESSGEVLEIGDLRLDFAAHLVELRGEAVELAPKEFRLLKLLATHPGRALTREQILERVWDEDTFCDPHTVDVHIRWLRQKIERDPSEPEHILTVRGVGYRFEDRDRRAADHGRRTQSYREG